MEKDILRICLISPLPPPYGGISHWTATIKEYASKNSNVEFISVNTAPRWRSIHSIGILLRAFGGGIQLLKDAGNLIKTLAGNRFDSAHLTTSGQLAAIRDLVFSYIISAFQVNLVYHIRFGRIPEISNINSLEWRIIRRVMRRASKVILIDKSTYSAVRFYAPEVNSVLIPNFVNFSSMPRTGLMKNEIKTVLFVGWVIPAKGISELVEAWSNLKPLGWRLEIVGPGDSAYQTQLIKQFHPENFTFIGALSHQETMKRMAICELFVLPSHTEGFPNVVVEAMALGRPILATEVGAIPEMLAEEAGMLVKSKDSKAIQEALARVLFDAELRSHLGKQASARAKRLYSIDVVFNEYIKIWQRD